MPQPPPSRPDGPAAGAPDADARSGSLGREPAGIRAAATLGTAVSGRGDIRVRGARCRRRAPPCIPVPDPQYSESMFGHGMPEPAPEPPPPARAVVAPPAARPVADRRAGADAGMQDFRDVVTEAERAWRRPSARSPARDAYDACRRPAEYDQRDPRMLDPQERITACIRCGDFQEPMLEPSFTTDDTRPPPPRMRPQPAPLEDDTQSNRRALKPKRSYRDVMKGVAVLLVVAGLGGALPWQWPNMVAAYQKLRAPAVTEVRDVPAPRRRGAPRSPTGSSPACSRARAHRTPRPAPRPARRSPRRWCSTKRIRPIRTASASSVRRSGGPR